MAGEEAGSGREKKWRPGGRSGGQVGEAAASPPLDPVGGEAGPEEEFVMNLFENCDVFDL